METVKVENLVAVAEKIPIGDPWATACDDAAVAIEELRSNAIGAVGFNQLLPSTSSLQNDISNQMQFISNLAVVEEAARLHNETLVHYPDFAANLRGKRGISILRSKLAAAASAHNRGADFIDEGVCEFEVMCSKDLADAGDEVARIVAEVVPGFEGRVATARAAHEANAASELERIEADHQTSRGVLDGEVAQRVAQDAEKRRQVGLDAIRAADRARVDRSKRLAMRLEKLGEPEIRLGGASGLASSIPTLIGTLREGGYKDATVDEIERAVTVAEARA